MNQDKMADPAYPPAGGPPAYGHNQVAPMAAPPDPAGYGAPQVGYAAPQVGYGAQQGGYGAQQGGYGAQQGGYGAPPPIAAVTVVQPRPQRTNLMFAIMMCLFCPFWLTVIPAIVFAVMSQSSYDANDPDDGDKKGRISFWLSIASLILSIVCIIVVIVIVVVAIDNSGGTVYGAGYNQYNCAYYGTCG